ncbi:MAG: hypothetical protein M1376_09575 [Planctomycetes bacterium]|nr:hypothetical protein [Planctomycetota bacterium]
MNLRRVFSTVVIVLAGFVTPGMAQETLGDLVASGGYDWIIGRWVASTEDGQKVEFDFAWALDRHMVLNNLQMGDFKYQGIITLSPIGQEAVDQGVDNRGGFWKGVWSPEGDGLVRRVEHTSPEGQVRKGDIVVDKADADTITIAIYPTDSSGNRSSEPMTKLTYKRQPQAKAVPVSAAAEASDRATDYQKLGDLVAEGGYTWLIGRWAGNENNQNYELEYQPILDKHAASVDMKIGDFRYAGLITYAPSRREVVEFGADTRGRTWKMVWAPDGSDLATKTEVTQADGTTQKFQHVFAKIDNDSFQGKLYTLTADGSRGSEPVEQVTFKRQKPAEKAK